jgi:peptidoglycan hydrolase-like protein with peptidoglycan-binding domain
MTYAFDDDGRKKCSAVTSFETRPMKAEMMVNKKMRTLKVISISFGKLALVSLLGILTVASANAGTRRSNEPEGKAAKVQEAEAMLSSLGYWITKVDGQSDDSTRHGIIAFQKVEGLKRTGVLDEKVLEALRIASRPTAKYQGEAHVEIDITRQVIFLVNDQGTVTNVISTSTGSGQRYFAEGKWETAYTPRGTFKITRQIKGIRVAPLGTIYYPSYFSGGVAIHGSNSIPVVAASHGCARIPRFADKQFNDMVKVGMPVYVYD